MKNPSIAAAQEAVLEIKDLSVRFGDFTAANKVTFNVKRGETVALVGESGSGKTTLGMALALTQKIYRQHASFDEDDILKNQGK